MSLNNYYIDNMPTVCSLLLISYLYLKSSVGVKYGTSYTSILRYVMCILLLLLLLLSKHFILIRMP